MNYEVLKTELTTDPLTRGYSGMSNAAAAADLNTEYREVDVEAVTGQQIFEATVPSEYNALGPSDTDLFHAIIGMGELLVSGTNTRAALMALFGAGTTTRTNLIALQTELISRAAELGLGTVKEGHIATARA
jgi:hypothetical protein